MTNGSIKNGTILSQSTVDLGLRDNQLGEAQPEQERPAPVAPIQKVLMLSKNETMDLISVIRYLLLFSESESKKKDNKKISRYFQILRLLMKEPGNTIIKHIFTVEGFTERELVELYNLNDPTVWRYVELLCDVGLIRKVGYVGRPYRRVSGKQVSVFLLDGSESVKAHDAQIRYGELIESRMVNTLRQTNLEEAFNYVKVFMEKRSTTIIPEYWHINDMLRENKIPCDNLPLLINKLRKAGYEWR